MDNIKLTRAVTNDCVCCLMSKH